VVQHRLQQIRIRIKRRRENMRDILHPFSEKTVRHAQCLESYVALMNCVTQFSSLDRDSPYFPFILSFRFLYSPLLPLFLSIQSSIHFPFPFFLLYASLYFLSHFFHLRR
jgi:hypothetical protein